MPSLTGGLWDWVWKKDNTGRDVAAGVWLTASVLCPPLLLIPVAAFGVTATADAVGAARSTRRSRAAAARRAYKQALRLIDASPLDDIEKHSARQHARQKYLKELNGAL